MNLTSAAKIWMLALVLPIGASTLFTMGFVGCTSRPQTNTERFQFAYVEPTCGPTDGPALEFLFTTKEERGGKYAEPYLIIEVIKDLPKSAPQNYSIKTNSSAILASRCLTSGRCETAISGSLELTKFSRLKDASGKDNLRFSGKYNLHFQDASIEKGNFDAEWHTVYLLCG